jgi:hypothetical protein
MRDRDSNATLPNMSGPTFDRDEVVVCMVIAFCLGNAVLSVIYRLMT